MESQKELNMEKYLKETDLNLKARFFALYWGQEVLIANPHVNQKHPFSCTQPWIYHNTDIAYLILKPLSKISDEDAIEVAKIVSPLLFLSLGNDNKQFIDKSETDFISVKHKRKRFSVDIDLDGYVYEYSELENNYTRPYKSYAGTDYLRSKGYALPYMDLSVKDLQDYGWIKLEE